MDNETKKEQIEKEIIELEKKLLEIAPEEVKKLYLEIDYLCCLQQNYQ